MDDPSTKDESDFDLKLQLKLRRRKVLLPGCFLLCLVLISTPQFWQVVDRLVAR